MHERDVIRIQLETEVSVARTCLGDLERRLADGSHPSLVQMAARGLQGCASRVLELAAEGTGARDRLEEASDA